MVATTETHAPRAKAYRESNGLASYIRLARSTRLLEAEEELALVARAQQGDRRATERLVLAHVPLVLKHALRVARSFSAPAVDLVQEGMLGLLEGVRRFDPGRGVRLNTYATWWIRAYLLRAVLANWRLVRVGTTKAQRSVFFNLQKEKRLLEKQGGEVSVAALAERMGLPENELLELERHLHSPEVALDQPSAGAAGNPGPSLAEALPGEEGLRPDLLAEQAEFGDQVRAKLNAFKATASPREQELIRRRWLVREPASLRELGQAFGVTGERARQMEAALLTRFQRYLRRELGEDSFAHAA